MGAGIQDTRGQRQTRVLDRQFSIGQRTQLQLLRRGAISDFEIELWCLDSYSRHLGQVRVFRLGNQGSSVSPGKHPVKRAAESGSSMFGFQRPAFKWFVVAWIGLAIYPNTPGQLRVAFDRILVLLTAPRLAHGCTLLMCYNRSSEILLVGATLTIAHL